MQDTAPTPTRRPHSTTGTPYVLGDWSTRQKALLILLVVPPFQIEPRLYVIQISLVAFSQHMDASDPQKGPAMGIAMSRIGMIATAAAGGGGGGDAAYKVQGKT